MASAKIILYTSKIFKNGESPIMIRMIQNRKPSYLSIGASSLKEHWDFETNQPKRSHPNHKQLRILIRTKLLEAEKMLLETETNGDMLSSNQLIDKVKPDKRPVQLTVGGYFKEVVQRLEDSNRIGYAEAFANTWKSLLNYHRGDFNFSQVTPLWLRRYEDYLEGKGLASNSIFLYLRTFKTLINYAVKEKRLSDKYNPFEGMSFSKYRHVKTRKRSLRKDDLMKIMDLAMNPENAHYDFWNFFRFSYLCWGINFIDMAHLKWNNITNNVLHYKRKKTDDLFNIPLLPEAEAILEYYKAQPRKPENPYVFPILSEFHNNAKSQANRIKKVRMQYNNALDEIGKLCGIQEKLTSYVARHTFANVLKQSGVPITVIQEAMGHESEAMTQVYVSQLDADILGNAVNSVLL